MKKKIIWRLKEQPTAETLQRLVENKILTKDEARQILFSFEEEKERDENSLKAEIKFLRELIEKLAESRSQIITTIREVEIPYKRYPWFEPYSTWTFSSKYNNTTGGSLDFSQITTW